MKFQAKVGGLMKGLEPANATATSTGMHEYDDQNKVSITSSKSELIFEACNGYVATSSNATGTTGIDYKPVADGTVTVDAKDFQEMLAAYSPDDLLTVELNGNELVVILESDQSQRSSMPIASKAIVMPVLATAFDKEVEIKRDTLLNVSRKVLFAVGEEKHRPHFLYWLLRVKHDGFRMVAGDGARFSIYEIEGLDVVKSQSEFDIAFSGEHNQLFQKILTLGSTDNVLIRESNVGSPQIVVTVDNITMCLIGHDSGIKWPDENKFLKRHNPIKHLTMLSDWEQPSDGIKATNNLDLRKQGQFHYYTMSFDTKKKLVTVQADHFMKTTRKIKLLDTKVDDGENPDTSFTCLSRYINDVVKYGDLTGKVQMEFVNPTASSNAPVVVKFFAGDKITDGPLFRSNAAKQTREQHVMFIAATSKPNQVTVKASADTVAAK